LLKLKGGIIIPYVKVPSGFFNIAPYDEFHSESESHVYLAVVNTVSVHISESSYYKSGSSSSIFNLDFKIK